MFSTGNTFQKIFFQNKMNKGLAISIICDDSEWCPKISQVFNVFDYETI